MIKYTIVRFLWIFINVLLIISAIYILTRFYIFRNMQASFNEMKTFLSIQYLDYMKGIFTRWDWGFTKRGEEVWALFLHKYLYTMKINLIAFIFYVPLGLALGVIAALKKNTIIDHAIGIFTLIFGSIPSFIMMFLLILIFGYALDIVPPLFPASYAPLHIRIKGYILPIVALSSEALTIFSRLMRAELSENLHADFMLLAKTKGLNKRQALFRHAIKTVMVPIIPVIASTFIYIMGAAFFMERVYNIPGLAMWFMDSTIKWDPTFQRYFINLDTYPLVIICAFYAFVSFSFMFIVDIIYHFVDPRIRMGSKKVEG